jgi:DNA-binding GntR family transcriptional regulator
MRILLEEFAIPLIMERITPSEIRQLEKNIEKTEESIGDASLQQIIRLETKFHEILYRITKSEILIDTIFSLIDRFQWLRAIALSTEQGVRESLSDHMKIFEAIVDKDQMRIKKHFREHLQHGREKVEAVQRLF